MATAKPRSQKVTAADKYEGEITVRLANCNLNVHAFGFYFDEDGLCRVDAKLAASHIDAKNLVVVTDIDAHIEQLQDSVE
jgi:hypothetical protein